MQCLKCKQETLEGQEFCKYCGAKSSIKLASLLRATGIVNIIIQSIGILITLAAFKCTQTLWSYIQDIFYILSVYIIILVIKNAKNYEKAGLLKKMGITYLVLVILNSIIHITSIIETIKFFSSTGLALGVVLLEIGLRIAIFIVIPCVCSVLYIIYSSKLEKMYLQSKDD